MAQTLSKTLLVSPELNKTMKNPYESEHFGQLMFSFFEEVEQSAGSSCDSLTHGYDGGESIGRDDEDQEDEEDNASRDEARNKAFWDSQEELLLATLRSTTSIESKIRQATKEALMEIKLKGDNCGCQEGLAISCRKCTMNQICDHLRKAGYGCTIYKSKWRKSLEIPAGEHTYVEVVTNSPSKKSDVKVIIELNFQAEFILARASEKYNRLISLLPEIFVGKVERLRALIKILCSASKRCMKEKKMHRAPWRKQQYMQAKWHGRPEFQPEQAKILPMHLERPPRARRTSMLTSNLLDNLHHATMIEVV